MSPWVEKVDSMGRPHYGLHRDGHRVALFDQGWWAYHMDYRYTRPGHPRIGPEPVGPFSTLDDAKSFVESQGFTSVFPFEVGDASSSISA